MEVVMLQGQGDGLVGRMEVSKIRPRHVVDIVCFLCVFSRFYRAEAVYMCPTRQVSEREALLGPGISHNTCSGSAGPTRSPQNWKPVMLVSL